jgi:hypothetical protein
MLGIDLARWSGENYPNNLATLEVQLEILRYLASAFRIENPGIWSWGFSGSPKVLLDLLSG